MTFLCDFLFCIRTFDFRRFLHYNDGRTSKEARQMKQKYHLALDTEERRLILESLNDLRNRLIKAGKYTDAVDELMIKFAKAKLKKFKVNFTE